MQLLFGIKAGTPITAEAVIEWPLLLYERVGRHPKCDRLPTEMPDRLLIAQK